MSFRSGNGLSLKFVGIPEPRYDRSGSPTPRHRRAMRWWEPMLPAGMWLLAASLILKGVRMLMRSGIRWRWGIHKGMRASSRLSRAGFNAWRFWNGKWRWPNWRRAPTTSS